MAEADREVRRLRLFFRHGRACPGHPRLPCCDTVKTWMPGTRPGMTSFANSIPYHSRDGTLQHPRFLSGNLEIPRCAIAHLRFASSTRPGMTFQDDYSDSGAVAASSHTLVVSSTCGRTAWRTRA